MRRALYVGLLPVVILLSTWCTSWEDETKGTGPAAATGSGGGAACLTCNDFFVSASTCQAPDCPSPDDVCAGAPRDALDAMLDCAFCDACPSECPDMCGAADAGLSDVTGPCQTCLIGAIAGACAAQYGACTAN